MNYLAEISNIIPPKARAAFFPLLLLAVAGLVYVSPVNPQHLEHRISLLEEESRTISQRLDDFRDDVSRYLCFDNYENAVRSSINCAALGIIK